MKTVKADEARLAELVDEASRGGDPIGLETESGRAILVSMSDWNSIQETLHLLSIPGMRESIREGMNTPVDECGTRLKRPRADRPPAGARSRA